VERLKTTWQGNELLDEDETLALTQVVIGEIELARLKSAGLSSYSLNLGLWKLKATVKIYSPILVCDTLVHTNMK